MKAPLLPVCLAFMLGIQLGAWLPLVLALPLTITTLLLVLLAHRRRPQTAQWALLIALVGLGSVRMALAVSLPSHHVGRIATEAPRQVQVQGIVRSDPVELPTSFGESRTAAVLSLTAINEGATWRPATGLVRVTWLDPAHPLRYGDDVLVEGALRRPLDPGNLGMFNYRTHLARQGIFATLRAQPHDGVVVLRRQQGRAAQALAYAWRERARIWCRHYLPPVEADFLTALLLGDRNALSPELEDAFILTGTMHVIAISGFNVGLIALCAMIFLRWLWVPRRWRLALTMALLGVFMLMTDSRAPVVRATVMAWVVLGGMLLQRTGTVVNSLSLAALALLAWNPRQLSDPGFQLSFAAVLAIVTLSPRFRDVFERTRLGARLARSRLGRGALALLTASVAAWLGTAPLVLHHFGVISPLGVLANLVVVPLVSLILIGGLALMMSAAVSPLISTGLGWWLALLIRSCTAMVTWLSHVPGSGWYVAPLPWWGVFLVAGCGLLAWQRQRLRWPEARVAAVWLLVFNAWIWARLLVPMPTTLRMTALDVGHGDAILLEFPHRGRLLIDGGAGGDYDQGRLAVAPYLRSRGIRRLDAVVLTHPDGDHVGGLAAILRSFDVGAVIENGDATETLLFQRYRQYITERRVPRVVVHRGDRLDGFDDVVIDVVHPGAERALRGNDRSLILRVRHGRRTFLLCGDADEAGLVSLLAHEPRFAADVVKVPHHGSRLGRLTQQFFERLEPTIAVISMAAHSRRPLPHPATLASLDRIGAETYLTGRDGAVTVASDGETLQVTSFRAHRR